MAKTRVELNLAGINEVMKSEYIQEACTAAGKAVAAATGQNYETKSGTINFIAFCDVFPGDNKANKDNLDNNTLLKAVGSVGLSTQK